MKIGDIMAPAKDLQRKFVLSGIDQDRDVLNMKIGDILALPPNLTVKNQTSRKVGTLEKELLLFLTETCDSWVLGQIVDRFNEGVVAVDAEGRIFYVNEAYSQILGVAKHNVLGKQLQKVEPGATILTVLKTGQPILGQAVHISSLNRDVTVNIYPIHYGGKLKAVVSIFRDVTETKQLTQALDRAQGLANYFRQQLEEQGDSVQNSIIGRHPAFLKMLSQAMIVAKTDAPVLLGGENGVGKEVIAKAVHLNSSRAQRPLINVNCAAIPEHLLESELFGYEEGSFTGAKRGGKLGKFELAEGGTIFLDEIGDLPLMMQSKLLRVLQEKEIEKIGRSHNIPIDVRIVAATNRPLEQMVKQGTFRSDLYYRLNVVEIKIPALRERGEDTCLLARHFLQHYNAKYHKQLVFSAEVLQFFAQYTWPGNVRELQNCIEYATIMCTEQQIYCEHLPDHMNAMEQVNQVSERDSVEELNTLETVVVSMRNKIQFTEKELIQEALIACQNNKSEAIKMLGISRRTFYRKLKEYGLYCGKSK